MPTKTRKAKHHRSSTSESVEKSPAPKMSKTGVTDNVVLQEILDTVKQISQHQTSQDKSLADLCSKVEKSVEVSADLDDRVKRLEDSNAKLISTVNILCNTVQDYKMRFGELTDDISDIRFRSMKMNLIFYNIPQNNDRSERYYENLIGNILVSKLKIPRDSLHSVDNLSGIIRIDIAHPIGKQGRGHRPIVVKFADRSSVERIFKFVHNLKGSDIRVARQLPRDMQLRRDAQYGNFKNLKTTDANPKAVKLVQDRLYDSNGLVSPTFSKSPLQMPVKVFSAQTDSISGQPCDGFIASIATVNTINSAENALTAMKATLNTGVSPYAYRLTVDGQLMTGHDDDGLFGASNELMSLLEEGEVNNALIIVHKSGTRLQPFNSKINPSFINAVKSALAASFLMDNAILETLG